MATTKRPSRHDRALCRFGRTTELPGRKKTCLCLFYAEFMLPERIPCNNYWQESMQKIKPWGKNKPVSNCCHGRGTVKKCKNPWDSRLTRESWQVWFNHHMWPLITMQPATPANTRSILTRLLINYVLRKKAVDALFMTVAGFRQVSIDFSLSLNAVYRKTGTLSLSGINCIAFRGLLLSRINCIPLGGGL